MKPRFAIFGNEYQIHKSAAIEQVLHSLKRRQAEVYVDKAFYDFLTSERKLCIHVDGVFEDNSFDADYVISMGGDGTFLKAAMRVGAKLIPIIGVNTGRLGFLADVLPDGFDDALEAICRGDYTIEEHTALQIETDGEHIAGNPFALNDVAVLKRDNASMISIHTSVNGEHLITYQADGLIISTPTGSTAYSLSNGGPIIIPHTGIFCLTPVAPHSLNIRPVVIDDNSIVKLRIESRSHNYLAAIDGRSERLSDSTTVTVSKAPFHIRIVKRKGQKAFASLREKMMWGADNREGMKED